MASDADCLFLRTSSCCPPLHHVDSLRNKCICVHAEKVDDVYFCVRGHSNHTRVCIHMCVYMCIIMVSFFLRCVRSRRTFYIYGWDARDRNMYTREREREERKKCRYMNGMCSTFDTGNLREELYVRNAYFTNRDSSSSHTHAHSSHTPKNDALIENTTTTMKKKIICIQRKRINSSQ